MGLESGEQESGWKYCHPKKNACSVSQEEVKMEMEEALVTLITEKKSRVYEWNEGVTE